jgi:muramoyltetrapeptide carboxypeptidase
MLAELGSGRGDKFGNETERGEAFGGEATEPIHACGIGGVAVDTDHLPQQFQGGRDLAVEELGQGVFVHRRQGEGMRNGGQRWKKRNDKTGFHWRNECVNENDESEPIMNDGSRNLRLTVTSAKAPLIPKKLRAGDEIRVLAFSRSIGGILQYPGFTEADIEFARQRLESLGLRVSFGEHVRECNAHLTAPMELRVRDLHRTLADVSVKGILAVTGGIGAIQLLEHVDYSLFAAYPKILCGYSDVAYLLNAIYAKTGLVSYYGPNFTSFMMRQGAEYSLGSFRECLFESQPLNVVPAREWSDDGWVNEQEKRSFLANEGWWAINPGAAEGVIVGGSGYCMNMAQGSEYFPALAEAILFLEHPGNGKASLMALDGSLRALSFQPQFSQVRGIVLGRYPRSAGIDREKLIGLVQSIPALARIPVLANCDFGHTTPIMTLPIGGNCRLRVREGKAEILITDH